MKKFDINQFNPCNEGTEYYATQVDFETAWNNCEHGDWMLWIAKKLKVDDRTLTLAKAYCANTARHLMKDQRSLDAVDAAIKYGNGQISREELNKFASDAKDAVADAYSDADADDYAAFADSSAAAAASAADYAASFANSYYASAAAYAASAAVSIDVADAYSDAAYTTSYSDADYSSAADAADYAAAAAKEENQKQTADICREYLTEEVFNKINNN